MSLRTVANSFRRLTHSASLLTSAMIPTTSSAARYLHQHRIPDEKTPNKAGTASEMQKRFVRDVCAQAESGKIDSALSAFEEMSGSWERVPDWAILKLVSSVARLDVEKAKELLKQHKEKTADIFMRQRTFHKDQIPTVLENFIKKGDDGFAKAKEIYWTIIELGLYKHKSECAELFIKHQLTKNGLDAAIRELLAMSEKFNSCLGLIPVLVEVSRTDDQKGFQSVFSCALKYSAEFQAKNAWLYALLENGKVDDAEMFLRAENFDLDVQIIDFINLQAAQRRKPIVIANLLKMRRIRKNVDLRENVYIGLAKAYTKLYDADGLKSVWHTLMREDHIIFSKSIGYLRTYFARLKLEPPPPVIEMKNWRPSD